MNIAEFLFQTWKIWAGVLALIMVLASLGGTKEPPPVGERTATNTHWAHQTTTQAGSWVIPALLFGLAVGVALYYVMK